MRSVSGKVRKHGSRLIVAGVLVLVLSIAGTARAQESMPSQAGQTSTSSADQTQALQEQIAALRAQVEKLQAAVESKSPAKAGQKQGMKMKAGAPNDKPMGDDAGEMSMPPKGMGMGDMDSMDEMGGMAGNGKQMGQMMNEMGGMMSKMGDMMGEMGGMPSSSGRAKTMAGHSASHTSSTPNTSALPGFPGASHLYHIGATGFFLDHSAEIGLTGEQQTTLNRLKEKALLDRATAQRRMEEAEQELWTLTAADQPDQTKIQAKIEQIEKVRGEQRLAFVKAVGEAAKTLTPEQRQMLLGSATSGKGR